MHPPQAKVIAQREESGIPLRLEKLQYTSGHLLGVSNPCPKIHTLALVKLEYKNSALNSEYINITRTKNSINAALYWQIKAKLREHDLHIFFPFLRLSNTLGTPLGCYYISGGYCWRRQQSQGISGMRERLCWTMDWSFLLPGIPQRTRKKQTQAPELRFEYSRGC